MPGNDKNEMKPTLGIRFAGVTIGGALMGFGLWCVLDWVTVSSLDYPKQVGTLDWIFLLFPLVQFAWAYWWIEKGVGFAIASTVLGSV